MSRDRGQSPRMLVLALTLVLVSGMTMAMVLPAESEEFGIVSAEFESDSPTVIEQGTEESFEYSVPNSGVIPTVVVLEPAGDRLDATPDTLYIDARASEPTEVSISAPPETGHYRAFLNRHHYLGILPTSVILELAEMHPWLPIVAINAVVAVPFYLFGMWILGGQYLRERSRGTESWFL